MINAGSGPSTHSAVPLLSWDAVEVWYPGGAGPDGVASSRAALSGVSLDLFPGEVLAILGPNGAGKSTLLHTATGWIRPAAGAIRFQGQPLVLLSRNQIARHLAFVAQSEQPPPDMTVLELVELGREPQRSAGSGLNGFLSGIFPSVGATGDRDAVHRALATACLEGLEHRPMGQLSGGERQRVLLARALAQEPSVLLMDEPSSSLDPLHQQSLVRLVRRLVADGAVGGAVVVLHDLNLAASLADRICLMARGAVVATGPVDEVLIPRNLEQVYGLPIGVTHLADGRPLCYLPA